MLGLLTPSWDVQRRPCESWGKRWRGGAGEEAVTLGRDPTEPLPDADGLSDHPVAAVPARRTMSTWA